MGCLFSADNSTRVQPFDNARENNNKPVTNGITKENGVTRTSQNRELKSDQNGHIPNTLVRDNGIPDTPRETEQTRQSESYVKTSKDERVTEEKEESISSTKLDEGNQTIVEPISLNCEAEERELEQTESSARAGDQTIRSSGEHSSREPVVVPTMSVKEEDLLNTHYTIKQISVHNQGKGYIDIFPLRKDVYSTSKFKEAVKGLVEEKYEEFDKKGKTYTKYESEKFYEAWKFNPIFIVLFRSKGLYLRFPDLKKVLPDCKVSSVNYDGEELGQDLIKDSKSMLSELEKESMLSELEKESMLSELEKDKKKSEYIKEYADVLTRFLDAFEKLQGSLGSDSTEQPSTGQDPNTLSFILPDTIHASDLRQWIVKWEPFDSALPPDGAWPVLPDKVVNAILEPFELEDICRVGSDGLPEFDFSIDGEAAWDVIKLDIVKNDETTDEQEKTWRSRDRRTDLNDPMFWLTKQTRLEMYFINKYEWDSSKLDPFRGFVGRLQRAWKEFESLCDTEDYSIIPDDEY